MQRPQENPQEKNAPSDGRDGNANVNVAGQRGTAAVREIGSRLVELEEEVGGRLARRFSLGWIEIISQGRGFACLVDFVAVKYCGG